ncbi:MAG TPA: rhodanese-like domain-containing protein [Kiritimatiellia bacterium]|jgi:phage shock protein E
MAKFYLVLFLVLVLAAAAQAMWGRPGADEKKTAKEKIKKGARLVDVRSAEEFVSGHAAGATNMPLPELEKRVGELGDKAQDLVVYCGSGVRAAKARKILNAAGFPNVFNVGGLRDVNEGP